MTEPNYLTREQYATLKDHLRKEVNRELRDKIATLDPESKLLAILDHLLLMIGRADDDVCGDAADSL